MDLGHRRKLQREIANTKRLAQDPAFVTPLYRIEPRPERTELKPTASGSSTNEFQVPSKRGYRHRPKSDPNAPERPYSAYVMFSNHTREQLKDQNLSFTESSRLVGERWQNLSPDEREAWKQRGAVPWEKYKSDMAEYQKTDGFQEYQRYLTDFKAAHAAKKPDRRPSSSQHNQSPSDYQGGNITELPSPVADSRRSVAFPSPKGAKKGLKRLKKDDESWEAGSHSPRVKQACEPCRQRKIKCHGEHPTCRHCRESGVDCYYSGGRRDSKKR